MDSLPVYDTRRWIQHVLKVSSKPYLRQQRRKWFKAWSKERRKWK